MTPFSYFANYNHYNNYDSDTKNNIRNSEYIVLISNMLSEMFDFTGLTHEQGGHLIRTILDNGSALVIKDNDNVIIGGGSYYGTPRKTEIYPDKYLCTIPDSENGFYRFDRKPNNTTEVVAYLIPQLLPIEQIYRFASQFAEIDTSLVNNIQFSRIAPVGVVSNDTIKTKFENVLKRMFKGDLINSIIAPLNPLNKEPFSITKLDLSDGKYSEKIQYLSMYHEQMISRLCKLYGISYTYISKQANITNDELHNSDDFCCIYPLMFKKNLNETLNKIGITADFSDPWKWINNAYLDRDITEDNNPHNDPVNEENKITVEEPKENEE